MHLHNNQDFYVFFTCDFPCGYSHAMFVKKRCIVFTWTESMKVNALDQPYWSYHYPGHSVLSSENLPFLFRGKSWNVYGTLARRLCTSHQASLNSEVGREDIVNLIAKLQTVENVQLLLLWFILFYFPSSSKNQFELIKFGYLILVICI